MLTGSGYLRPMIIWPQLLTRKPSFQHQKLVPKASKKYENKLCWNQQWHHLPRSKIKPCSPWQPLSDGYVNIAFLWLISILTFIFHKKIWLVAHSAVPIIQVNFAT